MSAREIDVALALGINGPFGEHETIPPPELFPKRPAWIVREVAGERRLDVMSWGFPHTITGASGKRIDKVVTNVRALASPFWRIALTNPDRRCLVPVTSFSEYGPGVPGKLPLYWFEVPSRPVFAFAGVWRPVAGAMSAFAFLTCEPNPLIAPIHGKAMPVVLHCEDFERWLSCPYAEVEQLAVPYPSQLMAIVAPPTDAALPIEGVLV